MSDRKPIVGGKHICQSQSSVARSAQDHSVRDPRRCDFALVGLPAWAQAPTSLTVVTDWSPFGAHGPLFWPRRKAG